MASTNKTLDRPSAPQYTRSQVIAAWDAWKRGLPIESVAEFEIFFHSIRERAMLLEEDRPGKDQKGKKRVPSRCDDAGPPRKQQEADLDGQAALLQRIRALEGHLQRIDKLEQTQATYATNDDRLEKLEASRCSTQARLTELRCMDKKIDNLQNQLKSVNVKLSKLDALTQRAEKIENWVPRGEQKPSKKAKSDNQLAQLDDLE
ncbi:hypothetical protein D9619_012431 [Psilocybe cf. subviscida]|uniref:Uncharacterized protein n=1 Tax=Psilocybe cf. subviscida TaxID=2480587 RepID=A0A8H5ARS0_9AGAR|nr:hypothetical protein D9619_012431 [Psilocybe cf. subviscida]